MEDKRIKECCVLLSDCRDVLPYWKAKRKRILDHQELSNDNHPSQPCTSKGSKRAEKRLIYPKEIHFVEQVPEDSYPSSDAPVKLPSLNNQESDYSNVILSKVISQNVKVLSVKKQLPKVLMTADRLRKIARKRRNASNNIQNFPAENHAKRHLLQKYGTSLLRKPSFSFESPIGKPDAMLYSEVLKGQPKNDTCSSNADAAPKCLNQTTSFNNFIHVKKDLQSILKTSSPSTHQRDSNETDSATKDNEAVTALPGRESKSTNFDLQGDLYIHGSEGNSFPRYFNPSVALPKISGLSNPNSEVIPCDSDCFYTNPSSPMPSVGLVVNVGIGRALLPQQAKCVMRCLDKCNDSLTSQYSEFCSSVVKSSSKPLVQKMILPVKDERILEFMRFKWGHRSIVKLSTPVKPGGLCKVPNACYAEGAPCVLSGINPECNVKSNQNIPSPEHQDNVENMNVIRKSKNIMESTGALKRKRCGVSDTSANCTFVGFDPSGRFDKNTSYAPGKGKMDNKSCPEKRINSDPDQGIFSGQDVSLGLSVKSPHKITLLSGDKEKSFDSPVQECKDADEGTLGVVNRRRSRRSTGKVAVHNIPERFKAGSDDEGRTTILKTIANIPEPSYDPDDTRGIEESERATKEHRIRDRSSLEHELRRLNVALFDCSDVIRCKLPDICRLGCVCSSLSTEAVRDNCGLVKCMFGCTCIDPQPMHREENTIQFTWAQNKAKANLAKEEQNFKQTVVRSGTDNIIHVEGKRKREIKLPGRYREDFFISDNELSLRQTLKKVVKSPETENSHKDPSMMQATRQNKTLLCPQVCSSSGKDSDQLSGLRTRESPHGVVPKVSQEEVEFTKRKRVTDHITSRNVAMKSTSKPPVKQDDCFSARTRPHFFRNKEDRLSKQKSFLENSAVEKVNSVEGLQISSTKSLLPSDWEGCDGYTSKGASSCSFLFSPDQIEKIEKDVVLLSWEALRTDIEKKKIFLWLKAFKCKPKIYLTKDLVKPSEYCVEFQTIDLLSEDYKILPFHLRTLRTDYTPTPGEGKCTWIAKYQKSHWMIVGYMQQGHNTDNKQLLGCDTQEVDILSSLEEDLSCRWWVMDIKQNFDLLYFLDFKKAITKAQITTLAKLSNEYAERENQIHRIVLNRRRPKLDPQPVPYPDFGAYSLPKRPTEVLIGPYYSFKEPRFLVYTKKIALNGKEEYEAVPLFYCGGGECVRVNSQGALSLRSESLPDKYVLGTWIPDFSNDPSEPYHPSTDIKQSSYQDIALGAKSAPDFVDLTETDSVEGAGEEMDISPRIDDLYLQGEMSKDEYLESVRETEKGIQKHSEDSQLFSDSVEGSTDKVKAFSKNSQRSRKRTLLTAGQKEKNSSSVPSSDSCSSPKNIQFNSMYSGRLRSRSKKSASKSSRISHPKEPVEGAEGSCEIEYLVPSEEGIGYLSLTHLPRDAISVSHFTERGLLTFYRSKEEIIKHINYLVHNKLACMSRKCSAAVTEDNEDCKCVTWTSSFETPLRLKRFNCKIFNGFFILTSYGLLDLRCADEEKIRILGKDWIEWLKNDEVRLKLADWKEKEEQELSKSHGNLSEVLTSSQTSHLPLPEVLLRARTEIAKLKAEDQLLDYESRTLQLLKETLTYSLSKKLTGIPNGVVPHFLEQLDLDLLWDVLECMDSRNTLLLPAESPPPHQHFTKSGNDSVNHVYQGKELSPSKMKPPIILRKSKPQPTNSLLPVDIIGTATNHVQKQARKQIFSKLSDSEEEPIFLDQSNFDLPIKNVPLFSQTSPSRPKSITESRSSNSATDGLIASTTDITDLNLCTPSIHSGPKAVVSPPVPSIDSNDVEKIDPISSLRISSVYSGTDSLVASMYPTTQDSSSTSSLVSGAVKDSDPISSLRITSVCSGVQPIVSSTSAQVLSSSASSILKQEDPISCLRISSVYSAQAPLSPAPSSVMSSISSIEQTDSTMPLRISSVYSTGEPIVSSGLKTMSTELPSTTSVLASVVDEETDPISSLRISSVYSGSKATSPTYLAAEGTSSNQMKNTVLLKASPNSLLTNVRSDSAFSSSIIGGKKLVIKPIFQTVSSKSKGYQIASNTSAISTTVGNLKHLSVMPKELGANVNDNSMMLPQQKMSRTFPKATAVSTTVGNLKHLSVMSEDSLKDLKLNQPSASGQDSLNQMLQTVRIVKKGGNKSVSLTVPITSLKKIDPSSPLNKAL